MSTLKVGLELYLRDGAEAVRQVRAAAPGCALFLDLKLHDIPNTVAGAARSVADLAPDLLTVHAAGGAAMVRAAADALPGTAVAAVTVLTSLSTDDLDAVGLRGPSLDAVRRLAALAVGAGARALVCSPQWRSAAVRAEVGPDVLLLTPGVRPAGAAVGDQARVAIRRGRAGRGCRPARGGSTRHRGARRRRRGGRAGRRAARAPLTGGLRNSAARVALGRALSLGSARVHGSVSRLIRDVRGDHPWLSRPSHPNSAQPPS